MPSDPEPSFGERLRRLRQQAGWSQEELAERADLTAAAIGALERGERRHPYPNTLQALARALELTGVDRAALFTSVPRRRSPGRSVSDPGERGRHLAGRCRVRRRRWWGEKRI